MRMPLLPVLLFAALLFAHGAEAKTIRAEAAEPVVEELMAGCSLKCAFAWRVVASAGLGGKPQPAAALTDESARSAWLAPAGQDGVGWRFRCEFPRKLPAEQEGETPLYGLNLVNGRWLSEEEWPQWARVKRARLWWNKTVWAEVTFPDTRRWVKAELPDVMIRSGDALTLEVLEVYPGTKHGLAISEIVLEGAH